MSIISKFLRLSNYQIDQSSIDGNYPIISGEFKGEDGACLDFNFNEPTELNAITLFEKGENVTDFEIFAESDGEYELIYKQNRCSPFRFCAIPQIKTTKIRILVLKTRHGHFGKISAYAYNLPKKNRDFRRTAYVVPSQKGKIDADNMKFYNNFNIIGKTKVDYKTGKVMFEDERIDGGTFSGKEIFEKWLALIRKNNKRAKIVVTFFTEGPIEKMVCNRNSIPEIKKFIDEYELDGVSFDWEYPKNAKQWRDFDEYLIALKEGIGEKSITLALASWLRYRFSQRALECIDVAEVMTYDNMQRDVDGYHSEFFSDGPNAIYHFVKMGFKLSQLNLGLPYYARPVDGTGYWSDYKLEAEKLGRYGNVAFDEYKDNDWKNKKITVKPRFYNCCQMVEDKTAFCIYADVGGIMCWHLGIDADHSNPLCLSAAVDKTIKERTTTAK